ncbi:monocarboxylate transporter 5 [Chironomus tepperi]|uniref:monocarboxylate transporter 5 n=1 Tax=Chironomus tepperi TaxID=113505 RepID=UPI00391F6712
MTHAPAAKRKDGEEAERPKHPDIDGGWGWYVVFASFMIHIVTDGVTYTLGIFYVEWLEYFHSGKAETSWIASILVGVTLCSGPISSGFVNKYGCRAVTIAGTIIAGVCLLLSVFAKNVFTLYITIGFGVGFGFGMIYLPAIVSVTMYFERLRSLATGIAVCGSGFGTVIFAPLTQFLIARYQWQGTLIFIAFVTFCCAIFGWMFRPLDLDEYGNPEILEPESPVSNNNNNNNIKYNKTESIQEENKNLLAPPPYNQIVRSLSFGNETFAAKTNGKSQNGHANKNGDEKGRLAISLSQPLLNDPNTIGWHIKKSHSGTLDRPDAFYMGSIHNIARQRSQLSLHATDRYGSMRRRSNNEEIDQVQVCGCIPCSEETHDTIKKMMSFSLLKDPVFLLFVASNFLTSIGFNMPYVYLAAQAETLKIDKQYASFLISAIGAANTLGRIILGYISDKPWINRLHVYNICLTICGVATALSALCVEFWGLLVYSTVFGFTIGAYVGLTSVILVDLLGLDNLTNAFGLLLMFQGIASFVGPPIGGWLYDISGKYEPAFVLAGVAIAVSGLILYFIPALQRYVARKEENRTTLALREL